MKKSREEILKINQFYTEFLIGVQNARHKPDENEYVVGNKIILDNSNKTTVLTKELVESLINEELKHFNDNRDKSPFKSKLELNFIESRLLISSQKDSKNYLSEIALSLEKLRSELNEDYLLILGDWNTNWLNQDNDYKPVFNALNYLKRFIDKDFNGGFIFFGNELVEFISHLFWLIRCNASLPYFYMTFPKSETIITLCKYGVLHFEFYNEKERKIILAKLKEINFQEIKRCGDPVDFDKFEGRKIKLSS